MMYRLPSKFWRNLLMWISISIVSTYFIIWTNVRYASVVYHEDSRRQSREVRQISLGEKMIYDDGGTELTVIKTSNSSYEVKYGSNSVVLSPALANFPVSLPPMLVAKEDPPYQSPQSLCPEDPPFLVGRLNPEVLNVVATISTADIFASFPELGPGGHWKPSICTARTKVAIIIPFRDRQTHLNVFLAYMIPILKRQLVEFFFVVVEQAGFALFNKGRLLNAGFQFAEAIGTDVVVFHDVDMVPEDDRNLYSCPNPPRHIAPFTDTLHYSLFYHYLVGGALCFTPTQFRKINGYSNQYWGWGGEDDDMGNRILANNFAISRPSALIGRYRMFFHKKRHAEAYEKRWNLINTSKTRWRVDGLKQPKWRVLEVNQTALYYHLLVDVGQQPSHLQSAGSAVPTSSSQLEPASSLFRQIYGNVTVQSL